MNQKTILVISAALTAFVLVAVGAVAGRAAAGRATSDSTQAASTAEISGLDPTVQAQIDARDAEYKKTIQEANQRLTEAYQKIQTLEAAAATPTASVTDSYPVSPELAVGLALNLVPGSTLVKWPDLVDFRGTAAYEIILDRGAVYIDASTARLLYNGATAAPAPSSGGSSGGGGGGEGEHEGGDD